MQEDLLKIINNYGVMAQLKYFQSEVFELNEAIITMRLEKWNLEGKSPEYVEPILNGYRLHIAEEIADVMVVLEQFKLYYGISEKEITNIFWNKVARTLERIESGYYDK